MRLPRFPLRLQCFPLQFATKISPPEVAKRLRGRAIPCPTCGYNVFHRRKSPCGFNAFRSQCCTFNRMPCHDRMTAATQSPPFCPLSPRSHLKGRGTTRSGVPPDATLPYLHSGLPPDMKRVLSLWVTARYRKSIFPRKSAPIDPPRICPKSTSTFYLGYHQIVHRSSRH